MENTYFERYFVRFGQIRRCDIEMENIVKMHHSTSHLFESKTSRSLLLASGVSNEITLEVVFNRCNVFFVSAIEKYLRII